MRKSFSKRIRITKTGKVLRRQMAQDHFRAKRTGKQTRNKRKSVSFDSYDGKKFKNIFRI